MSIRDDLEKYPVYVWEKRKLVKIPNLTCWNSLYQLHHFIRKSTERNSKDFFKRVEHLQKLILLPAKMHYDLHSMGEVTFFKTYGVNKNDFLFSRQKWREGYYDGEYRAT